jgi:hypothetical protein
MSEAVFTDPPSARPPRLDDTRLVGIATYSFLRPAVGLTHLLFVEELYVARDYWRTGVGRLLMNGLLEVAAKQECSRVGSMTDLDNPDAQQFCAAALGSRSTHPRCSTECKAQSFSGPVTTPISRCLGGARVDQGPVAPDKRRVTHLYRLL